MKWIDKICTCLKREITFEKYKRFFTACKKFLQEERNEEGESKKRETGGVKREVRRTGRTAQEQPHSRGFPQDCRPRGAASPLKHPVARSRTT